MEAVEVDLNCRSICVDGGLSENIGILGLSDKEITDMYMFYLRRSDTQQMNDIYAYDKHGMPLKLSIGVDFNAGSSVRITVGVTKVKR